MSILTGKLNQTATWEQATGSGGRGPSYGPAQTIAVRVQFREQKRLNTAGEEYAQIAVFWMEEKPGINDRITYDGEAYYVRDRGDLVGLDGKVHGWQASTGGVRV